MSKKKQPIAIKELFQSLELIRNFIMLTDKDWLECYSDKNLGDYGFIVYAYEQEEFKHIFEANDVSIPFIFGGAEGDGETHWVIIKHKNNHFQLPGYFNSYNMDGDTTYYWDDIFQVEPYEKIEIAYRPIGSKDE